jgi:hypothetical protein
MCVYRSVTISTVAILLIIGSSELQSNQAGKLCYFTHNDGTKTEIFSEGYGADAKVQFAITDKNTYGTKRMNFVAKDRVLYIWGENQKRGFISPLVDKTKLPGVNTDDTGMECRDWSVDNSKFEIPKDIVWKPLKTH